MNKKQRRGLLSFCCALLIGAVSIGVASCTETPPVDSSNSSSTGGETIGGYEGGEFYAGGTDEAATGADELSFGADGSVTLKIDGQTMAGTYSFVDDTFTLLFTDSNVTATIEDDVVTLTYGGETYTFLKKVEYKVSYSVEGNVTSTKKVINGRPLSAPTAPEKAGNVFVGWYTDAAFTTQFAFDATPVKADITLYARFIEVSEDTVEVRVNYVVDGEEAFDSVSTIGGVVVNLPTPEKAGATFAGWWMSSTNDAEKLTCKYTNQVLKQDTTLYAVWESNAPLVSVDEDGIRWTAKGVNNNYTLVIEAPDGTSKTQNLGVNEYAYNFDAAVAGEYKVSVTLNGNTMVVYYSNKMLAQVSQFSVKESSVLMFNAVENAEKYLISIDCGTAGHVHNEYDNGNSTVYDFSACDMQPGGIKFTVKAVANGWLTSEASYSVEKNLEGLTVSVDKATDTINWTPVENATKYQISLNGNVVQTVSATTTSFDMKSYRPMDWTVRVTAIAHGYNDSTASVVYQKTSLVVPTGVKLEGSKVTWNAVSGATGYTVKINDQEYTTTTNELALTTDYFGSNATSCVIQVKANGATEEQNSLYGDVVTVRFGEMSQNIAYANGRVTWDPVFNIKRYMVNINNEIFAIPATENSCAATFTTAGAQSIRVWCIKADNTESESVSLTVTAYEMKFETEGGRDVASVYMAAGDMVSLPIATRDGYEFNGWFNSPNGTNGSKYDDEISQPAGTMSVYAHWTANQYEVILDTHVDGAELQKNTVTYDQGYQLMVPVNSDVTKAFTGWYSEPNGQGFKYTDHLGASATVWQDLNGRTLYAGWVNVFEFTLDIGGESYSVKQGAGISLVTSVTIPAQYEGKPVTRIEGSAFKSCGDLVEINIPDTMQEIFTGAMGSNGAGAAFTYCYDLKRVNVYEVEGNHEVFFKSVDGLLYKVSPLDADVQTMELIFVPQALDGAIVLPEGVTALAVQVFKSSKVTEVSIPTTLSLIGSQAFYLSKLEKLTFAVEEEGVEPIELTIEAKAFQSCSSLVSVNLPARLKDLSTDIFTSCSKLAEIHVQGTNGNYSSTADGVLLDSNGTTLVYCPIGRSGSYQIPDGVRSIGANAFASCKNLTEIIIPGHISSIGKEAFKSCTGLTSVKFLGVEDDLGLEIAESAFYGCTGLTEITLPVNLSKLEKNAFGGTTKLVTVTLLTKGNVNLANAAFGSTATTPVFYVTTLNLGAHVEAFDISGVFGQKITTVNVDENNSNIASIDGALYDRDVTEIIYYPISKAGEYVSPTTLKRIGANVFRGNVVLTKVTIGAAVEYIGEDAFSGCNKMTELVFADGGTQALVIADRAFQNVSKVTAISLPSRVTTIGEAAFQGWDSLTEFIIPEGVKEIGEKAFYHSDNLQTVSLPASLEKLGHYESGTSLDSLDVDYFVFDYCKSLTNLTVAAGNKYYKAINGVLYGLTGDVVTDLYACPAGVGGVVDIPKTVTKIWNRAFYNNQNVTEVMFSEGIEEGATLTFGENVFEQCKNLTKLSLPVGLTEIAYNMFYYCQSLKEIVVPYTVTKIADRAFYYCTSLNKITFQETPEGEEVRELTFANGTQASQSSGGVYYYSMFYNCRELKEIAFPERTAYIGAYLFAEGSYQGSYQGTYIEKVSIPSTVKYIGPYAFYHATKLKELTFADTIAMTDFANASVFSYTAIQELVLPEGLEKFSGSSTFSSCSNLTSLVLPSTLQEIGDHTFAYASKLTSITFRGEEDVLTKIGDYAFYSSTRLKSFDIPDTVTSIGNSAFSSSGITSIEIPASVETIGNSAFASCSSLATLTFAEGSKLESIGTSAFASTAITEVVFPTTPDTIALGKNSFQNCKKLERVYLSSSIASINDVFVTCPKLTKIDIAEDNVNFKAHETLPIITNLDATAVRLIYGEIKGELVIPEGYEEISNRAFENQTSLTKIVIPKTMKKIGDYAFSNCSALQAVEFADECVLSAIGTYAFQNCSSLTAITLPDNITKGSNYMFSGCTALASVTLPEGMTTLAQYMFKGCTSLKTIDLPDTMTSFGNYAFNASGLTSITFPANYVGTSVSADNSAFLDCKALKSIILPDALKYIPNSMFKGCLALESVQTMTAEGELVNRLPAALKEIGSASFRNAIFDSISMEACTKLTKFGTYAFADNANLTSIVLPNSVTTVSNYMFLNCTSLTSVTLPTNTSFKSLANYMFQNCTALETITLPDSLTYLGTYTFSGSGLTSITIPSKVTCFGTSATACTISSKSYLFENCVNLKTVTLHKDFEKIGGYAFIGCTALETVTNTEGVTLVGSYAFQNSGLQSITFENLENSASTATMGTYVFDGCARLTSVSLPKLQKLGNYAFRNCTSLESIELLKLSGKTTSISMGSNAFQGCTALKNITLDANLKYIPSYFFDGCTSLTSITLPTALTQIGNYAFNKTSLASVTIPQNVTQLGQYAFFGTALKNVTIPAKVSILGNVVFGDCQSLEYILVDPKNSTFMSWEGALCKTNGTLVCYPAGMDRVEELVLPDDVIFQGYAFYGCNNIGKIVVPDTVTSIPGYTFAYCGATEIVLPETLETLATYAFAYSFANNDGANHLVLPESITAIPNYAFSYSGIKTIQLHSQLESIGSYAFQYSGLTSIEIPDTVTAMGTTSASTGATTSYIFREATNLVSVKLPTSLTTIGQYMFDGCVSLTTVTIPETVVQVENYAFRNCSSYANQALLNQITTMGNYAFQNTAFTSLVIPETLTTIGTYAFAGSVQLESVTIPSTITALPNYMFQNCSALKTVNLPETLQAIGTYVFQNCTALTSINLPEGLISLGMYAFDGAGLTSIKIPASVETYGTYLFRNCVNLASVELPDTCLTIPSYMFQNCTSLTSIELPAELAKIESFAFAASGLTSIVFPKTLTYISNSVFADCTAITEVFIPETVINVYSKAFANWTKDQTIYVEASGLGSWISSWAEGSTATIIWGYTA